MILLDELVQLHENITIFYVVDGWIAELWTNDNSRKVAEGKGDTIMNALYKLRAGLIKQGITTLEKVRGR